MSDELIPLSQIADIIGGYAFKSGDFGATGFHVVKIANIEPPRVNLAAGERIPASKVAGLDRFRLNDRDIVMAMTGATIGKVGRVRSREPSYLNQRVAKLSAKAGAQFDDFIFALVTQSGFDAEVLNNSNGSAQANISTDGIGRILIPDFSRAEQLQIGRVIGSLDDKIESNGRMNETLESLAQSLFKSWFVDATQSALPKGWRESTIGEEVHVVGGSTPSTTKPEFWDGGTHHWATPKDLSNLSSPALLDTERRITDAGLQEISSGLLPTGTVLLSSRAPIGYLAISEVPIAVNQGFIALVCGKTLPNYFVRLWVKNNMEAIEGRANGTTFMEISKTNFRPLPVIVPPPPVLAEFTRQVEPLHRRVVSNLQESRTLAALRDALLPKLLSGELRLPATEKELASYA
jgi:type I restriction enzyme S subunit